ncbi:MAG: ribulose phosphate epimerase [Myxococcota bacterium]
MTSSSFIPVPDSGTDFICDLFTQDCPPGEKCMPWANNGGSTWNATRCSPIVDAPGSAGDPCTVEGSGTSGLDDCELGTMCWDVDPRTNTGECVALCTGNEVNPICEDPETFCSIPADGALVLCLPRCHPLEDDCEDTQGCYPTHTEWQCIPTATMGDAVYGTPCEFLNGCEQGLICLGPEAFLDCEGPIGCCGEVCDLDDPQCTDADQGMICTPWYANEDAPPGAENLGVCALPA